MPFSAIPSRDRKVTLKDIGAALGLSHVTVSLALRDRAEIPEVRRAQVKAMAAQMGYRPNALGAGLAQYRANTKVRPVSAVIAWLNLWPEPARLRSYREFDLYWQGASEAALRHGYRLEEFVAGTQFPLRRVVQILKARNIRGILIPPCGGNSSRHLLTLPKSAWSHFSVVRLGYTIPTPRVTIVTSHHVGNVRLALERMRAKGYRRIGFVTEKKQVSLGLHGYMGDSAQQPERRRVTPLRLDEGTALPEKEERRRRAFVDWLRREKPDSVVTDMKEVRAWLDREGLRVPEDIGLAALSILDGDADAGIDQQAWHIGKAASEVIISRINHQEFGEPAVCREILVEGRWIDGNGVR